MYARKSQENSFRRREGNHKKHDKLGRWSVVIGRVVPPFSVKVGNYENWHVCVYSKIINKTNDRWNLPPVFHNNFQFSAINPLWFVSFSFHSFIGITFFYYLFPNHFIINSNFPLFLIIIRYPLFFLCFSISNFFTFLLNLFIIVIFFYSEEFFFNF